MARRRRRRSEGRKRSADNSLLTIVLAIGAVLLLSGGLTGAQIGSGSRDELLSRQTFGVPAGSQVREGQVCYSSYFGDTVYSGRDVVRTGVLFQGQVSTIVGRCVNGRMLYQVCEETKASLGRRKIVARDTTITATTQIPTTGIHCITHDERAFLNSAGPEAPPGVYVQPRGPTLTGAQL